MIHRLNAFFTRVCSRRVNYAPGGTSAFGPMLNAAIHTLMYSYYFLTGMGFKPSWKASRMSFLVAALYM